MKPLSIEELSHDDCTTNRPHPIAHAIAALYGTEDDTLLAWQRAYAQAAEMLRSQHDEERVRKALTLAQDGHVTLEDDGFATVESRGAHYEVQADGAGACPDTQHRGVTCKHALAAQIHTQALTLVAPSAAPAETAMPRVQGWKPTPKTSARWDVHEAPASACFKFRVGGVELLYTLRDVDDAELVRRITATLPTLHDVMDAYETRATPRDTAPEAASAAPAQPDLQALVQQAVAAVLAQMPARTSPNGHGYPTAPTASSVQCRHGAQHARAGRWRGRRSSWRRPHAAKAAARQGTTAPTSGSA